MKKSNRRRLLIMLLPIILLLGASSYCREENGFDLRGSLVPVEDIHLGGPARDGIPAIDNPKFVVAGQANVLEPEARVLGLARSGQARAYPVAIMNWHEIVNDRIGPERIAVTFCPLCGTGVAFRSLAAGRELTFGVSGLLYNSDVLLYDRETESLWSQLLKQAVSGPMKGQTLATLPLTHTTWRAWKQEHPDTMVLSADTGYNRDYVRDPYAGYAREEGIYFPVRAESRRYHPKERVLGVEIDGKFKAYPFAELSLVHRGELTDSFAGRQLRIHFDSANESARAFDAEDNQLPGVISFWFAWYAFHPETEVFTAER
jgi:hypothetical protein